ncbi:MAG: MFS transporter [Deltaproteobacteria bacterium]|nr:MFS transporter [Deltaproteobacteria bacterium]
MRTSSRPLPPTVLALGLISLLTDVGSEMIFPLLPLFFAQALGATPAFIGVVEGAADTVSSVLKLYAGRWSDRMARRKPLITAGYALAAFTRPLFAVVGTPIQALLVRVTDRVGKGLRSAPRDALLADAVDARDAGRAFGFHRAMDHTGAVLGPIVATALLAMGFELRAVFAFAVIPGAVAVLLAALVPEARRSDPPAPDPSREIVKDGRLPAPLVRYLKILAIFSLGNATDAFLLLRASELGLSATLVPLLWTELHLVKAGASYFGGRLADRVPRVQVILGGWAVYTVVYLGFAIGSGSALAWVLFAIYGLYHGLAEPAEKALVQDLAPAPLRGTAFGYWNLIKGASALPAGLIIGGLWTLLGAPVALVTVALVGGASSLLLLRWWRALPPSPVAGAPPVR